MNGVAGQFSAAPVTGTYSVGANGEGSLVINGGSAGTLSMTLDLAAQASQGLLVDNTSGYIGGGDLDPVTAALTSTSQVSGSYSIILGSGTLSSNDNSVGRLNLAAGDVASGEMDENDNGNYLQNNTVSGSYEVAENNRGTLALTIGAETQHFTFYAISPDDLELVQTDPGVIAGGELSVQSATAINASANPGGWVLQLSGSGTGKSFDTLLGSVSVNPTSDTGGTVLFSNLFENDNGNYQPVIVGPATTYTLSATGRGTMTINTPEGQRDLVFYVQSPNILNVLETSIGFGNLSGFSLGVQNGSPTVSAGHYVFLMAQTAPNSSSESTVQGILTLNAAGQISGQENLDSGGVITARQVTGTLSLDNATGAYTLVLNLGGGKTANYVLLAVGNNDLAGISTDADEVSVGAMIVQYTTQ